MVSSYIITSLCSYAIIGRYHLWNNYSVNVCGHIDVQFVLNNYVSYRAMNILQTTLLCLRRYNLDNARVS